MGLNYFGIIIVTFFARDSKELNFVELFSVEAEDVVSYKSLVIVDSLLNVNDLFGSGIKQV